MRRSRGYSALFVLPAVAGLTLLLSGWRLSAPVSTSGIASPFDLVSATTDPNGYLLNPVWTTQQGSPGALADPAICGGKPWTSACTSQTTWIDDSWKCAGVGTLGGHANWAPVSYTGTAYWNNHSNPGADDDYNVDLYRDDHAGLTVGSEKSETLGKAPVLHMEFDSDETIDHFSTPWWSAFHSAVDGGKAKAQKMIDGNRAVALGLMGLDYAHSGGSELHPVFALAVETAPGFDDNAWAIFVRNRGNEGYCGSGNEELGSKRITLLLSHPGATNVEIVADTFLFGPNDLSAARAAEVSGPDVALLYNVGALVTFTLPDAQAGARINGSLHLRWKTANAALAAAKATLLNRVDLKTLIANEASHNAKAHVPPKSPEGVTEPEEVAAAKIAALSPRQRALYARLVPQKQVTIDRGRLRATRGATITTPRIAPAPGRVRRVADVHRDSLDRQKASALERARRAAR